MGGCVLTQVDWGALATLATGVMAVGAALWVGYRQTEIQRDQVKLGLLDKRFTVIGELRDLDNFFSGREQLDADKYRHLLDTFNLAQAIFPDSLHVQITEAYNASVNAILARQPATWSAAGGRSDSELVLLNSDSEQLDRVMVLVSQAHTLMSNLLPALIAHARVDL